MNYTGKSLLSVIALTNLVFMNQSYSNCQRHRFKVTLLWNQIKWHSASAIIYGLIYGNVVPVNLIWFGLANVKMRMRRAFVIKVKLRLRLSWQLTFCTRLLTAKKTQDKAGNNSEPLVYKYVVFWGNLKQAFYEWRLQSFHCSRFNCRLIG